MISSKQRMILAFPYETGKQADENMMLLPEFSEWTMSERNYMAIKEQMLLLARYFKWTVKGGRI